MHVVAYQSVVLAPKRCVVHDGPSNHSPAESNASSPFATCGTPTYSDSRMQSGIIQVFSYYPQKINVVKYVLSLDILWANMFRSNIQFYSNLSNLIYRVPFLCGIMALKTKKRCSFKSQTCSKYIGPSEDPCCWFCSSFFTKNQGLGMLGWWDMSQSGHLIAASCLCLFTLASDSVIWSLCFEWSTRLLVSQYNIHMHVAFLIGDDESKANTTLKSTWNDSFSSLFVDPEDHFISAPSMNTRSCPVWKCLPEDLRWWEVFESEDMQRISGWNHLFEWGYSMTTYTSYIIETIIFL